MTALVLINPGTGNLSETTEENAITNIKHLLTDRDDPEIKFIRIPEKDYGEGRYAFLLWKKNVCREVQMPGLPLEEVRFTDRKTQNVYEFPRLYIDDSSWIWCIAISVLTPFELPEDY